MNACRSIGTSLVPRPFTHFSGIRHLWDTVLHAVTCTIKRYFQYHQNWLQIKKTQYLGFFFFHYDCHSHSSSISCNTACTPLSTIASNIPELNLLLLLQFILLNFAILPFFDLLCSAQNAQLSASCMLEKTYCPKFMLAD